MRIKESDWRYVVDALLFICLVGMVFIGVLLGLVISEGPVSSGGSKYFLGLHRHQWGNIHAYLSIAFVVLMVIHLILSWKWITAKTQQIFKRQATPVLVAIGALPFVVLLLFWVWTPKDADAFRSYGLGAQQGQSVRSAPVREVTPQAEERAQLGQTPAKEDAARKTLLPPEKGVRQDDLLTAEKPAVPAVEPEHFREEEHHAQVGSITITGQQTLRDLEKATGIPAQTIARELGLPEGVPLNETLGRLRRLYGFEIQDVRDLVARLFKERESSWN
jgi:hypothetical protein